MDRNELKNILPHREPMLLVDEAYVSDDNIAHGSYIVKGDEYFLQGHFPNNPIVPGVIQCEMAAQTCCVLLGEKISGCTPLFSGMNKVKFKTVVKPGDTINFECSLIREMPPFYFAECKGIVNGKICVSGEFSFALIKN
ncbi:MAG: beta-hydroxyacyl-ACP dehydratase [Clostridiales bacterium GWF2_38_85]|nr:MAG: beta-hydroxyacyl-ACP dehydratase [Clostridiales bacterium GWF2_38_85]HBL85241.1 beta-hydroxyacyl-ACP dehydratase [Clostridiales bacterium]